MIYQLQGLLLPCNAKMRRHVKNAEYDAGIKCWTLVYVQYTHPSPGTYWRGDFILSSPLMSRLLFAGRGGQLSSSPYHSHRVMVVLRFPTTLSWLKIKKRKIFIAILSFKHGKIACICLHSVHTTQTGCSASR